MKNFLSVRLTVCVLLFFATANLCAQDPEKGFSFQGYARDFEGAALSSQTVTVQFSISEQNAVAEYTEAHTITTDAYGVFNAVIGKGTPAVGSFREIDFAAKNYWLKVDVKAFNSDFVTVSNTELGSVPYAKASRSAVRADNGVPPGTILPFAGITPPDGYLLCDGALYNNSQYAELADVLSDTWGGNGTSNFRVPDLRGYFLRGVDGSANVDPDKNARTSKNGSQSGNNVGSYQDDDFKQHDHPAGELGTNTTGAHTHTWTEEYSTDEGGNGTVSILWDDQDMGNRTVTTSSNGNHSHTVTGTTGDRGGAESRPKNAYVLYIIKY